MGSVHEGEGSASAWLWFDSLSDTHTQHCTHRAIRLVSFQKMEFWRILRI